MVDTLTLSRITGEQKIALRMLALKVTGKDDISYMVRFIATSWNSPQLQQVLSELAADYRRQLVEQAARQGPEGEDNE